MARITIDQTKFERITIIILKIFGYFGYVLSWIGFGNGILMIIGGYGLKGENALDVFIFSCVALGVTHLVVYDQSPIHRLNSKLKLFGWKSDIKNGSES